jgi:hypothetical protein
MELMLDNAKELWQQLEQLKRAEWEQSVSDRMSGILPLMPDDWAAGSHPQTLKLNNTDRRNLRIFCAESGKTQQEVMLAALQMYLWAHGKAAWSV